MANYRLERYLTKTGLRQQLQTSRSVRSGRKALITNDRLASNVRTAIGGNRARNDAASIHVYFKSLNVTMSPRRSDQRLPKCKRRTNEAYVDTTMLDPGEYCVPPTRSIHLWWWHIDEYHMCWMKSSEANEPLHRQHLITTTPQIDALPVADGRMETQWPILVLDEWTMREKPRR